MKTDNNHKYYVNRYGEHVRRVSDVIKILAKEQITIWANMLGFKGVSYKKELERTANIGSLFHSVNEAYFNKKIIAVTNWEDYGIEDDNDKIEARHAIDSFMLWIREFKKHHSYNVRHTEFVVVGDNLGGTIDCIIDGWDDPEKAIFVDYKTSSDFYLTQFLQLAAYVMIYEEIYGTDTVEGVMVVIADKKKGHKAKARFLPRKEMDPFISCFQCMYDVAVGTHLLNTALKELTMEVY